MENNKYAITFKTSANEEDKAVGDSVETTTTIVFEGWTDEDFKAAAAETVKIRQIQPRIRKGEPIGAEYKASRPGTRGAVNVEAVYTSKFDAMTEEEQDLEIERLQELKRRKALRSGN